jgi:hypothetical protein
MNNFTPVSAAVGGDAVAEIVHAALLLLMLEAASADLVSPSA